MDVIHGKWVQIEGQAYAGLWFQFNTDGTFEAQYEPMGIVSSGKFDIDGNEINMQQTTHTLGMVGEFKGLFKIEDDELRMSLASSPGGTRPEDLSNARIYRKN